MTSSRRASPGASATRVLTGPSTHVPDSVVSDSTARARILVTGSKTGTVSSWRRPVPRQGSADSAWPSECCDRATGNLGWGLRGPRTAPVRVGTGLAGLHPVMVSSGAATPRVSVLHVLAPALVGGLEAVVAALAQGARGSNVEAHVAAVIPSGQLDHPFLLLLRNAGVGVFAIEVPRRGYLQERAEIAGLCRGLRPDVVHTHGYRADVEDQRVARGLGIPVVSTVHGFTHGGPRNRFYQWLQRRALRRF